MEQEKKRQSKVKLAQLRALIAVAEHNSFSEAALELEMAQSAVSNAIGALESDLGVVLFSRGRHGAELTPAGERILVHAQQILHLQEQILKEASLMSSLQGGKVRVTSIRSVATHLLPTMIAQFQQRFPGIAVSVIEQFDEQSIEDDLSKGRADIGFTDDLMNSKFETWEFLRDEFVVLLPLSYSEARFQLSWEHFKAYPLIVATNEYSSDKDAYEHCARFCNSMQPRYHAKSDSTIVNMVAQGLGVAILPRLAAEPVPSNVYIHSLPTPFFRTIRMAIVAERNCSPHAFAFMEFLKTSEFLFNQSFISNFGFSTVDSGAFPG